MLHNLPQMTMERDVDESKYTPEVLESFDSRDVQIAEKDMRVQISQAQREVYNKRNKLQSKKNPFLASVMDDPRAFFDKMEARFEAQKSLTPEDPYSFEFGDYGIPVLQDIDQSLDEEIATLKKKKRANALAATGSETAFLSAAETSPWTRLFHPFATRREKNLDVGLQFLEDLKSDIGQHLEEDSVSYKRLNELSYFSSRALGQFDREDLSFFDRNFLRIDRHLLGHKSNSVETEYQRYKNNDFQVFQKEAGDSGIQLASQVFEKALLNPERFELASLPVARSLGPGVFMQLMPHDIFLMGVAPEPEAADGFNRPGSDFYLHDMRHSASIFAKRRVYEREHNLSEAQIKKLEVMQSVWKQEMIKEKKKIEDKELRYAIGFFSFNHHHDRGIPQLPSSFITADHGKVADKLYLALNLSGQPIGFKNPKETINKAYAWLQDFWLKRLPQEEEILKASAPQIQAKAS